MAFPPRSLPRLALAPGGRPGRSGPGAGAGACLPAPPERALGTLGRGTCASTNASRLSDPFGGATRLTRSAACPAPPPPSSSTAAPRAARHRRRPLFRHPRLEPRWRIEAQTTSPVSPLPPRLNPVAPDACLLSEAAAAPEVPRPRQLREESLRQLAELPGGRLARSRAGRSRQAASCASRSVVGSDIQQVPSRGRAAVARRRRRQIRRCALMCSGREDPASRSVRINMSSLSPTAAPGSNMALGPIRQQRTEQTANAGAERIQHCSDRDVVISEPTLGPVVR